MMHGQQSAIEPEGLFDGLSLRAIMLGAVVDHVATIFVFLALGFWLSADALLEDGEAAERAIKELWLSPAYLLGSMVLGLGCTVLGAFVGARRAGRFFLRHGGWIAVISVALSMVFLIFPSESESLTPVWYEILGWALILPAGLLGGVLAQAASSD